MKQHPHVRVLDVDGQFAPPLEIGLLAPKLRPRVVAPIDASLGLGDAGVDGRFGDLARLESRDVGRTVRLVQQVDALRVLRAEIIVRLHGVDDIIDALGHKSRNRGNAMPSGTVNARFDFAKVEAIVKTAGKVVPVVLDQKVAGLHKK